MVGMTQVCSVQLVPECWSLTKPETTSPGGRGVSVPTTPF